MRQDKSEGAPDGTASRRGCEADAAGTGGHAGGMKLRAMQERAAVIRLRHLQVAETRFYAIFGHLKAARRTIVRCRAVGRAQSSKFTFIYPANSLFFNWNCLCVHLNAKPLFDKRKPVDRGV